MPNHHKELINLLILAYMIQLKRFPEQISYQLNYEINKITRQGT